jgi:hypothetical protein
VLAGGIMVGVLSLCIAFTLNLAITVVTVRAATKHDSALLNVIDDRKTVANSHRCAKFTSSAF